MNAFDDIRRAALSIEADFSNTNAAAGELSELGETVPQIEPHHLVLPLVCSLADADPSQLKPLVDSCARGYSAGLLTSFTHGLTSTLLAPIDGMRQPGTTPAGQVTMHLDRLEALCSAPSLAVGMADASAILDPLEVAASAQSNAFIQRMRANAAALESRSPAEGVPVSSNEVRV